MDRSHGARKVETYIQAVSGCDGSPEVFKIAAAAAEITAASALRHRFTAPRLTSPDTEAAVGPAFAIRQDTSVVD